MNKKRIAKKLPNFVLIAEREGMPTQCPGCNGKRSRTVAMYPHIVWCPNCGAIGTEEINRLTGNIYHVFIPSRVLKTRKGK